MDSLLQSVDSQTVLVVAAIATQAPKDRGVVFTIETAASSIQR
jgi:hypothetical protein